MEHRPALLQEVIQRFREGFNDEYKLGGWTEKKGRGEGRGMICCSGQVWNWEWGSEFFKLLWFSDPEIPTNTPSHCKHEAFWWNEECPEKNNTLRHPCTSCWVWMGPRKRLKITVYRRTNGLLTTQLLIRHNFPCIRLSFRPGWNLNMAPKQVYFEIKACTECSLQKWNMGSGDHADLHQCCFSHYSAEQKHQSTAAVASTYFAR